MMKVYQYVVVYRQQDKHDQKDHIVDQGFVIAKDEQGACIEIGRRDAVAVEATDKLEILLRPF